MAIIQDIDESRAPLMEHLVELRTRLLKALVVVFIAFCICFAFSKPIYEFIGAPVQQALGAHAKLISTDITGQLMVRTKLALTVALYCAFPVIAVQVWKFIAPGLYKHEKKAVLPFIIMTPVLFTLGAALAYWIMPQAIKFLLLDFGLNSADGSGLNVETTPDVQKYFSFVLQMTFGFGVAFLLPVLLMLLERAGIVTLETLVGGRRFAIVIAAVIAALLTPPDFTSQFMLFLPLVILYEITIIAIRITHKRKAKERAAEEAAEAEEAKAEALKATTAPAE
jgi:sec-independent protein translocase protein TatC